MSELNEMVQKGAFGNEQPKLEDVEKYHFGYIAPDEETKSFLENARAKFGELLVHLHTVPNSRERALAITMLEKSLMFATKSIVVAALKKEVPVIGGALAEKATEVMEKLSEDLK